MLEKFKNDIIRISQKAETIGLCQQKSGNFSIMDRTTGYVVITPSAVDRMAMVTDDICVLDLEGNLIESKNKLRASSEFMMHLEIYKSREDISAVAHTHSKMATVFAVLNKPIPAIVYEVAGCGLKDGIIPVAPYGRPGTTALSNSVIEPCKRSDILLMEKHGIVAFSKDIDSALLNAIYAEDLADMYYHALVLNGLQEPPAFTAEELCAWQYPEVKNKKL